MNKFIVDNGLEYVCSWYWLKVCENGEFIFDIDGERKPFELLLIAKTKDFRVDDSFPMKCGIVSVPTLHSQKPLLDRLLSPFCGSKPKKLELFSRRCLPGWTCCGNEVLSFNNC